MLNRIVCILVPVLLSASLSLAGQEVPLKEQIGQMLMVGFRGLNGAAASPVLSDIRNGRIAGVVLFDYDVPLKKAERNIQSPEQLKALIAELQAAAPVPLLVAVDQEGGRVNRLKERYGFPPSVSAARLGRSGPEATRRQSEITAKALASVGININFAPSVDLAVNPDNPVIAKIERSFSADPQVVTENAAAWIEGHHKYGILTTLKHFPGHGSSRADSHLGFVDVTDSWSRAELIPYRELIGRGLCDTVMSAHIYDRTLDPQFPATLSTSIIGGLLREDLGFQGVVFSDDLQMKAISSQYGLERAVERAIGADLDFLVFANNSVYEPDIARRVVEIVARLVGEGRISADRIHRSWERITALKQRMGATKSAQGARE